MDVVSKSIIPPREKLVIVNGDICILVDYISSTLSYGPGNLVGLKCKESDVPL